MTFDQFFEGIKSCPLKLCQALNFIPTPDQRKILELVKLERDLSHSEQKRRIAIRSGQGAGKTRLSCIIILWRQIQAKDALAVVTAPTSRQLKKVFLTEFRRMILEAHPAIRNFVEVSKSEVVFFNRPNWMIMLVSSAKPEAAQGIHQDNLTILIDEMSGVDDELITQFLGTLSNQDSLLVGIGNPTKRSGAFFKAFHKDRSLWHTYKVSVEGCPIVDQENVRRLEAEFGRDSDVFRVRVLGEFPTIDPNVIFDLGQLEVCAENDVVEFARKTSSKAFGIDLARFGNDTSTIFQRSGNAIVRWEKFVKWEPADVLREAIRWNHESGWTDAEFIVDVGGLGGGAVHVLHESGVKVTEFVFNSNASDAQFKDRITEAYFNLSFMVKELSISIPDDDLLMTELVERQYLYHPSGQLIIEPKKEYKKRMEGASPDRADGLVMSFAQNTMKGTRTYRAGDVIKGSSEGVVRPSGMGKVWRMSGSGRDVGSRVWGA